MFILRALMKGVFAFMSVLSMALSFAPPTAFESAFFGDAPERRQVMERRLAIGFLKLEDYGVFGPVARQLDIPEHLLLAALTDLATQAPLQQVEQVSTPAARPDGASSSARFIQVN